MTVALVVPCFNEAARWNAEYWQQLCGWDGVVWRFVDDGSVDDTAELVRALSGPSVSVTVLARNVGKGEAIRQGMLSLETSEVAWIGFIDADGAFPIDEVARFVALVDQLPQHVSAVWSSRVSMRGRQIERHPSRHYIGRVVSTLLSLRVRNIPYDSQSGLKLFRMDARFLSAIEDPFRTRWLFDVELLTRLDEIHADKAWLWEEPLLAWRDVDGSRIRGREVLRIQAEVLRLLKWW